MMDDFNQFIATALKGDFFAGGLALGVFGLAAAIQGWLLAHSADPDRAATVAGIVAPVLAVAAE